MRLTSTNSRQAVRAYFKAWGALAFAAALGASLGGYGASLWAQALTESMAIGALYLVVTIGLPVVGTAGGGVLFGGGLARLLARKGRLKG